MFILHADSLLNQIMFILIGGYKEMTKQNWLIGVGYGLSVALS